MNEAVWAQPSGAEPWRRTTSTPRCRPAAAGTAALLGVSPSAAATLQPVTAFHMASDPSEAAQGLRNSPEALPGLTACPKRGSSRQIVSFREFGPKRALSYELWCEELVHEQRCKAGLNLPVLQHEGKRRSLVHPQPPRRWLRGAGSPTPSPAGAAPRHRVHRVPSWLNPAGITPNGLVLPEQHKSGFTAPSAT